MVEEGLPFKIFMFFSGGGDNFQSDYPVVASPTLNREFLGAESIYNGGGGINQEPFQLINAEYSWNSRSNGFFSDPGTYEAAVDLWKKYVVNDLRPGPLFDPGGMLDRVCALLYGRGAGKHVAELIACLLRPTKSKPLRACGKSSTPCLFFGEAWLSIRLAGD
jgi:hypothetical protein